nr:uncharacterized protein At4g02000-like [Quercus suber]
MVAKFLTKRVLSVEAVIRTFSPLWRSTRGFEVRRAGDHVLLFVFDNKEEVDKILSSAPWSFDKHLVVLQWYDREVPIGAQKFETIPVWVQVHGIPVRFLNQKVAEELCEGAGSVCKGNDITEMEGGSFMRVRVLTDINKPLNKGRRFSSSQGKQGWASFKYERLPNLCYWCGCLSHVDKDCELIVKAS